MLTLCIDTSYKYLSCCLIKDHEIIASFDEECFKRQSEKVFVVLEDLFNKANVKREDIDAIAITKGPGSYTGVRIAITIAKVLAGVKHVDLYTISTLKLYAGGQKNTLVLLNARSNRAYAGIYDQNKCLLEDCVKELDDIDIKDYTIVGDGSLFGKDDYMPIVSKCFLSCFDELEKCVDPDHLVPVYLKESESYLK